MNHFSLRILALVALALQAAVLVAGPVQAGDKGATRARIETALAGEHRSATNRARDKYRHPLETLTFFGLDSSMTVVEIWPGGGWYTEVLAPVLRDDGAFIAASFGEDTTPDYRPRLHRELVAMAAANPAVFDQTRITTWQLPDKSSLGQPGSADMVVTFRNTHGWINDGVQKVAYQAMYDVLKPGGILGVVQHRAEAGADHRESAKRGYVPEAYVVELVESIGFKLDGSSEINANPKDTRDHPKGVWTLPPVLRLKEQDREHYLAIGESDRMTLRFVKPAE